MDFLFNDIGSDKVYPYLSPEALHRFPLLFPLMTDRSTLPHALQPVCSVKKIASFTVDCVCAKRGGASSAQFGCPSGFWQ